MVTSPDGITWTADGAPSDVGLDSIVAGGDRLLLAGTARTPDGMKTVVYSVTDKGWIRSPAEITGRMQPLLTYGNGIFAAMGDRDVLVSADGMDWTARPLPAGVSGQALVYTGTEFAALGSRWTGSTGEAVLLRSPDAEHWTVDVTTGLPYFHGFTYAAGHYLATGTDGAVFTSTDGVAWVTHAGAGRHNLNGIACGAGVCVAVGEAGDIAISENLAGWTDLSPEPGQVAGSAAYGGGQFLAGTWGKAFTSTDGVTWQPLDPQAVLLGLWYRNGHWLAGGSSGNGRWIMLSEDGRNWRSGVDLGVSTGVEDIAYGKGRYVVGIYNLGPGVLSADLQTLTVTQLPPGGYGGPLMGVAYGKGLFAGVSGNRILYSADGYTWNRAEVGPAPADDIEYTFRDVAYGNGHFVAVGGEHSGFVYASADGRTWTQMADSPSGLSGVIYGGGQFLAWGQGEIMTSADGRIWSHQLNRAGAAQFVYGAGRFIAVGAGQTLMTGLGCGTAFPDVPTGHAACDAVEQLARRGVVSGDPDGSFRPEAPVTRAQLTKMVGAAAGLQPATGSSYSDIEGSEWFAGWVAAARQADLVGAGGYHPLWSGDSFGGDEPASRGEAAILLDNLSNY